MTSGWMPLYLVQMTMPLREPLPSLALWKRTVICYINSYELLLTIQRTLGMSTTKRCILEPALLVLSELVWCWALIPKWNHNVHTLKSHTAPCSPTPTLSALQLREESDPKAKTLLFKLPHVGEQPASCQLVVQSLWTRSLEQGSLPMCHLKAVFLCWHGHWFFFSCVWFSHVFKYGQKEKIVFS